MNNLTPLEKNKDKNHFFKRQTILLNKHVIGTLFKYFLFFCLVLLLSSCSSNSAIKESPLPQEDNSVPEEKVETSDVSSREPLFVYKNQAPSDAKSIKLGINSEPLLLSSGYIRLVGVVSGVRPVAIIEVAGKGLCVEIGDEVCGYKIESISAKNIYMLKMEVNNG